MTITDDDPQPKVIDAPSTLIKDWPEDQPAEPPEPSTALAHPEPEPPPFEMTTEVEQSIKGLGFPSPSEWLAITGMAETLSRSKIVPYALQGKPEDIVVILLTGRDLALQPTYALNKIHVIKGKPGLAAEAMCALVLRAGFFIGPKEGNDDTQATAVGKRGQHTFEFTFTLDLAVRAGLCQLKDGRAFARDSHGDRLPWEAYTHSMLWARAVSALCRMAFSDVLMGITYVPEELGAEYVDEAGNPIIDVESSYRPPGEPPPPREPTVDEQCQAWGWADENDFKVHRTLLATLASASPEIAARVKVWQRDENVGSQRAWDWIRVWAAFQWFGTNGVDAAPDAEGASSPVEAPVSPSAPPEPSAPVSVASTPGGPGEPRKAVEPSTLSVEEQREALTAMGITADLLATPATKRSDVERKAVAAALTSGYGNVLLQWMAEALSTAHPGTPSPRSTSESESEPVVEQPALDTALPDLSAEDNDLASRATTEQVEVIGGAVKAMKMVDVDAGLVEEGLTCDGVPEDRRRRLAVRLVARAVFEAEAFTEEDPGAE